jgi:hypothetical protein
MPQGHLLLVLEEKYFLQRLSLHVKRVEPEGIDSVFDFIVDDS